MARHHGFGVSLLAVVVTRLIILFHVVALCTLTVGQLRGSQCLLQSSALRSVEQAVLRALVVFNSCVLPTALCAALASNLA
jgi:hypothetical protein